MINKDVVYQLVAEFLQGKDCFLTDVSVSKDNSIVVEIDSKQGVDIYTCCEINNFIELNLNRDIEDYSLEVGSAGITSPFKVKKQYEKNIGNEVEVLSGGKKIFGILKEVGDDYFVVEVEKKEKGSRIVNHEQLRFSYTEVKYTKYNLKFN
ncbi:MAG: ribosome assembly cofactor RimP [Bacteroidia bacterium]|nr:ribosome assembly cofactor RimP [Bacteroidia bacterium]